MTYVDPAAAARAWQSMPPPLRAVGEAGLDGAPASYRLPVRGQGTIGFTVSQSESFTVTARSRAPGAPALRWSVGSYEVTLAELSIDGGETELLRVPESASMPRSPAPIGSASTATTASCATARGRCGSAPCSRPSIPFSRPEGQPDPWAWLAGIQDVEIAAEIGGFVDLWKDPVTIELPMRVVPHDSITMEDIAYGG
jgi:hypothetical protein